MLYNQTGSETSNMAAFKPEVHLAKLVDKIGTKVQLLYIYVYNIYVCVCLCACVRACVCVYEVQLPNRTKGPIATFYQKV